MERQERALRSYAAYEAKRNAAGLRNAQVARAAGVPASCIYDWKQGSYTPKYEKLQKIAEVVGSTVTEIMEGGE